MTPQTQDVSTHDVPSGETALDLLKRVLVVAELVAKAQVSDTDSAAKTQSPESSVW